MPTNTYYEVGQGNAIYYQLSIFACKKKYSFTPQVYKYVSMSVEIEAAKLILPCFLDEPENEVQRNNLIRGKVAENEKVKKNVPDFLMRKKTQKQLFVLQSQISGEW